MLIEFSVESPVSFQPKGIIRTKDQTTGRARFGSFCNLVVRDLLQFPQQHISNQIEVALQNETKVRLLFKIPMLEARSNLSGDFINIGIPGKVLIHSNTKEFSRCNLIYRGIINNEELELLRPDQNKFRFVLSRVRSLAICHSLTLLGPC